MEDRTIRRLNALNREFYRLTVRNFDESRGRPWPGWRRALPYLAALRHPNGERLRVLDVGCGNGRFGRFLARQIDPDLAYHGMDNAPELLNAAREDFAQMGVYRDAILEERDIVEDPPDQDSFDLVVAFGVFHHVPGYETRRHLARSLAERVAPGGLLIFTAWCFYEYERFREKFVAWPPDLTAEPGDYLMDWRRGHAANTALRYCHYIDDTEHRALVADIESMTAGLREIAHFRADGHTDDINRYSILKRD